MDWDDDPTPPRYRLCRAGFAAVGLGLALMGFSAAFELLILFSEQQQQQQLWKLTRHPVWIWAINAPITWLTLIGSYLIWAGRGDADWRRRAGFFLILNAIDLVQWAVSHAEALGMQPGAVGHPWLRFQVSMGFQWIEDALCATLAAELAGSLGDVKAAALANKVRVLAAAGGALWAIGLVHNTDWNRGWPLVGRQIIFRFDPLWALVLFGGLALTVLTTLNGVALCASACRRCSRAIVKAIPEDEHGLDLLRSRSETWEDDAWK